VGLTKDVNIFLSTKRWTKTLADGVDLKQHVYALYERVFEEKEMELFPKESDISFVKGVYRYLYIAYKSKLNILCPDYPVILGFILSIIKFKNNNVFHTWVVPFHSKNSLKAFLFDVIKYLGMFRSLAIVVASSHQKELLRKIGINKPIFFSPVSVDSNFWFHESCKDTLAKFGLEKGSYVLTVGGSDRDEIYSAKLAKILKLNYVRCGYDKDILALAKINLNKQDLLGHTTFIHNPSHAELRVLYSDCALLCLPTIIKTNPAGLSSLVEGMSCGALVAFPSELAAGYFNDEEAGLFLKRSAQDFSDKFNRTKTLHSVIKVNARNNAVKELNISKISKCLKRDLISIGVL
jgi:glycosyltransferase involved in cell wall biosynthesis